MSYTEYFNKELIDKIENRLKALRPEASFSPPLSQSELEGSPLKMRSLKIGNHFGRAYRQLEKELSLAEWRTFFGPKLESGTGIFTTGYWLMPLSSWLEGEPFSHKKILSISFELTKRHTAEYCLRPILFKNQSLLFDTFLAWHKDPCFHVRRLSSEALRPLLPWAKKWTPSPFEIEKSLFILKALSEDPSSYVRKSVANHLRDLLKLFPSKALPLFKTLNRGTPYQRWIAKHATRNNLVPSKR